MGTLKLSNSSGNFVALTPPSSIASDVTLTLPNTDGDANQFLQTNGSGTLTWATETTTNLTRGTAAATTSGTEVDFTSLPTGIRKITLVLDEVSVNGTSNIRVQFSTGSTFLTTGYISSSARVQSGAAPSFNSSTNSFVVINNDNANREFSGNFTWFNITGNVWVLSGNANDDSFVRSMVSAGRVDLAGTLDGIKVRTDDGFDNGQVNIFYEV